MTDPATSEPTGRRNRLRTGLLTVAALVGVLLIVAILVFLFTGNTEESEQPAAVDPETALTDAVTAEVEGATVEFIPGQVAVDFPVRQGTTPSSTVLSAQDDTIGVLRAVQDSDWEGTVEITAHIVPVGQTGDADEREALRVVYLPGTVEQIDPDGIGREAVWEVADEQFVDPALSE